MKFWRIYIGGCEMRIQGVAAAILLTTAGANAEIVTTTDGRQIDLKDDGTYSIVEKAVATGIKLEEKEPFFQHFAGEYNQNSMRFMPIVLNQTGKTVVGFKFRTAFNSAFGDEIFAFEGESSEKVKPGAMSTAAAFYYFEDNQFIGDEPYDKLKIFEGSGTGKISTSVTAVVFEDGEVVKSGQ
jgi:hypothetical protein